MGLRLVDLTTGEVIASLQQLEAFDFERVDE